MIANAAEPRAKEPVSENAITRASISGGTCCCSAVAENVLDTAEPTPAASAAAATP